MNTSIDFTNFTSKAPSTQEPAKLFELSLGLVIIITFLMVVALILTVVGNLAVMIVFVSSDLLRSTVNNHFLFSLALADLLVGLLVMPCAIDALRTQTWRCGVFMKYFTGFGNFCFCISSIMHLMMLSVDKYLSIIKPLKYPSIMTQRRVYLFCFLLWFYSAFWALLPLMGISSYECFIPYIGFCAPEDWSKYGLNFAFAISVVSGTYGVALIVMFLVYWRIAKVIKDQSLKILPSEQTNKKSKKQKLFQKHKGVLTLITLIITYLICWSPFCVLLFVEIGKGEKVDSAISLIGMLTGFVNSCCNPIIYWVKYSSFRRAVLRMCKKGFPFLASSLSDNVIHNMSQTGAGYDTMEPSLYVDRIVKNGYRDSLRPSSVYNDGEIEMSESVN